MLDASADAIVPFASSVTECSVCHALLFGDETSLMCCQNGQHVLSDAAWPRFDEGYKELLCAMPYVFHEQASFVNHKFAAVVINSEHEPGRAVFSFPSFRDCSLTHLAGRSFRNGRSLYLTVPGNAEREEYSCPNVLKQYLMEAHTGVQHLESICAKSEAPHVSEPTQYLEVNFWEQPSSNQAAALGNFRGSCCIPSISYSIAQSLEMQFISTGVPVDSLVFPLLLPRGFGGPDGHATLEKFYKRVLYQRFTDLLMLPLVTEVFLLDAYSRCQEQKLCGVASVCRRIATQSALENKDTDARHVGRQWFIPRNVAGSPEYLRRIIKNGMAVITRYGAPHLFVTLTVNDNSNDAQQTLSRCAPYLTRTSIPCDCGSTPSSILMCRLFRDRISALTQDLKNGQTLGVRATYYQRVKEWQGRGYDHCHIICQLDIETGLESASEVDKYVTTRYFFAELCPRCLDASDQSCMCTAHKLHRIVARCHIHTCRVGRCKKNAAAPCKRGYPKELNPVTFLNNQGRWEYKRIFEEDRNVVPYNSKLLLRHGPAHLNVECCSGPGAAYYMRKYTAKLPDSVRMRLHEKGGDVQNMIREWQKARYVGSSEAASTIYEMKVHDMFPGVTELTFHLPGQLRVIYSPLSPDEAMESAEGKSNLLRYFARNESLSEFTFVRYFESYKLETTNRKEGLRDNMVPYMFAVRRHYVHVCRLADVNRNNSELFALRLLLLHCPAVSFDDAIGGFPSFWDRAVSIGLIESENEARNAMFDLINRDMTALAISSLHDQGECVERECTAEEVVQFFIAIARNSEHAVVREVFEEFWPYMNRMIVGFQSPDAVQMKHESLRVVEQEMFKRFENNEKIGLPSVLQFNDGRREIPINLMRKHAAFESKLDTDQQHVLQVVFDAISLNTGGVFFLAGDAGTGKTSLVRCLTAKVRLELNASVVTSCFMASTAQLHFEGGTCHANFALPVIEDICSATNIHSKIERCSARGRRLEKASLLVIDEAPMLHQKYLTLMDEATREVCMSHRVFGGKVVLMIGDFKQLGPFTSDVTESAAENASLRFWEHWDSVKQFSLQRSHRISDVRYKTFCTSVGVGQFPGCIPAGKHFSVTHPPGSTAVDSLEKGSNLLFDMATRRDGTIDFCEVACISFTNREVDRLNHHLILTHAERCKRKIECAVSADRVESQSAFSRDFSPDSIVPLSQSHASIAPGTLQLFEGSLLICLRNIDAENGICNGMRAIVRYVSPYRLTVEILEDPTFKGKVIHVPRIIFSASSPLPVNATLYRRQFPFRLGYAITANKSQGKTMKFVLLNGTTDTFTHGMLYTSLSRVRSGANLAILYESVTTKKSLAAVCYRSVLSHADLQRNSDWENCDELFEFE